MTDTVTLAGGLVVSLAALQLVWRLEDRGLDLHIDGPDLVVSPAPLVTPADLLALRTWKPDVLAIVTYCETVQ